MAKWPNARGKKALAEGQGLALELEARSSSGLYLLVQLIQIQYSFKTNTIWMRGNFLECNKLLLNMESIPRDKRQGELLVSVRFTESKALVADYYQKVGLIFIWQSVRIIF